MADFKHIRNLLKKRIGLHAEAVGESSIERAISHRMSHVGISSSKDYFNLIENESKEFGELIEEVVVPETWFFRNINPFHALRKCASSMCEIGNDKGEREAIKILSLPCATGEEPYSIAMALREEGLGKNNFHIDAVDISKRALTKARRAIYGKHSFREPDEGIQKKYFKKIRSGFHLLPDIKDHVSFSKANIIRENISPSPGYYDIIFCRNLLIYFSRDYQKIVLNKLSIALKEGGILFVGHAETSQINRNKFTKLDFVKSFAYYKNSISMLGTTVSIESNRSNRDPVDKLKNIYDQLVEVTKKDIRLSQKIKQRAKNKFNNNHSKKTDTEIVWLKVEKLVDSGHFQQATDVCERLLKSEPENADGYYYLGLISNLCGSVGVAESLLKKAIYLAPHHQKALSLSVHLAIARGDDENADYYRRREQKALKKISDE